MATKIKDLTVNQLQSLISTTVKASVEDILENIAALSSRKYLRSVKQARKEYKKGKVKRLEELFGA